MSYFRSSAAVVALAVSSAALAGPTVTSPFAQLLNNSANSNSFATGPILHWGANNVPEGHSLWGVTLQCPKGANCTDEAPDPDFVRQALYYRSFTTTPNQYFASRPWPGDDSLSGSWTLVVSSDPSFPNDPALTTVINTPTLAGVQEPMPFVKNMTISGAGLTPSFSWTMPDALPSGTEIDRVRIGIVDNTPGHRVTVTSRSPLLDHSFTQGDVIFIDLVSPGATSYVVPAGVLEAGHQYSIGIWLEDLRGDGSLLSRSASYFDFTPLGSSIADSVYLPTTAPVPTTSGLVSGAPYSFSNVPAFEDQVTFIDPVVATGFEYRTAVGDPNFKSVQIATDVGDGWYEVWLWDGANWVLADANLEVNEVFMFADGGVSAFQIRGIETSAGLSPFDVTAFVTGLTFVSDGTFNGTMQALVAEVDSIPEPPVVALMLAALGFMLWSRRRAV